MEWENKLKQKSLGSLPSPGNLKNVLFFVKNGLGYILGHFFTNTSGHPGANPPIASYNASIVNFYNATGSLACFEN
jgi:hypothetical protein